MIAMLLAAQALTLDVQAASRFAQLALKCVRREYPNKLDHVMNGPEEVRSPKALHPSFYGCYDWHSTVHGLSHALDYAEAAHDEKLAALVKERARAYFAKDYDAPLRWEPGGEDFLSPSLEEAALMARVLEPPAFRKWVQGFLPALLKSGKLEPAKISDRTDPKIVHLDGLNLSRAWCLYAL